MGILEGGKRKFSKWLLKQLVQWLFLCFPRVSPEEIPTIPFWDTVGSKLTELTSKGDALIAKFLSLFVLTMSVLAEERKMEEKLNLTPKLPHPLIQNPCPLHQKVCARQTAMQRR